jgi:prolyl-tRNA synthetase
MNKPEASEQNPDKAETTGQKVNKSKDVPIGKSQAKAPTQKAGKKKKIDGAALIGIDVAKEDDFSGWYQQVLLKGDMLDYYDVSGCYILKVPKRSPIQRQS